ncbi:AAA family ATPase [Flavobacterium sp. Arc2]|uniref:AAA family ATPase n=1 Tax=Flavobacterium sp. Arc2 TaxID=3046685 RepID=UPI00352BD361
MIQKLTKIKDFGILDNHKQDIVTKPFNVFNLVYGWNGSGKTTLARLFRCLETNKNHSEFAEADFVIESETNGKVDSKTYNHDLEIKVFNQDFIKENLELIDATTKPIVFISKTKIEEKKLLDKHKIDLIASELEFKKIDKNLSVFNKTSDDFHKDAAKSIKDFFLGTIYATVSYNKSHSSAIWGRIKSGTETVESYVLTEHDLTNQKNYTLSGSEKAEIDTTTLPGAINIEKVAEIYNEVNSLIATNISAKVIERLKDNPDIGEWVATGLALHKTHDSANCEFCGQTLPENCIENLEAHYNKEYQELIDRITELAAKLEQGIRSEIVNESHLFFQKFTERYNSSLAATNTNLRFVFVKIQYLISVLAIKKSNPFVTLEKVVFENEVFENFNIHLTTVVDVIGEHNSTSKAYSDLAAKAKSNIENHFVSQAAITKDLKTIEKEITENATLKESQIKASKFLIAAIKILTDDLSNDTLAITEINENLHKFLGRNEIILQRQEQGGYQLLRNGIVARNLSEGEKTAISLIYFFSKIRENDTKIGNQIIVLDDPISSFDSNHLFNASSFIKNSTHGARQIFVLTHNFWFFKQVRDWMKSKNKKDGNNVMQIKAHFYSAKSGQITDADKTLSETHSEYQFVFKSILEFQNADNLNPSDYFYIANSVRRLLEGFSSFKTASNSGMEGVFDLGRKYNFDQMQRDRIYYFVQKYSHLDRIESFDNTIEPLLEESLHVVNDVLTLIELVDKDHYKYMLKACNC